MEAADVIFLLCTGVPETIFLIFLDYITNHFFSKLLKAIVRSIKKRACVVLERKAPQKNGLSPTHYELYRDKEEKSMDEQMMEQMIEDVKKNKPYDEYCWAEISEAIGTRNIEENPYSVYRI